VPGGNVVLGFDLDAWQPTAEQVADYQESVEEGYGYGPDLRAHLTQVLSPRRRVTLASVLMARSRIHHPVPMGQRLSPRPVPYGDQAGPQQEPNALGLRIAYDSYRTELTSDVTAVHGGDGGESVCGGYGGLLEWLPLATADRNPFHATEFVHSPIGEDMYHLFSTRPVLAL
jgi:hypothetical protein